MLPSFVARIRPAVGRVASAPLRVAGMVRASAPMTTSVRARPAFVVPFRRTFAAAAAPAGPLPAASPAQPDTGVQQTMPAESDDKTLKITRKFTHSVVSEPSIKTGGDYTLPHPIWKKDYLENVQITHLPPKSTLDTVALWTIRIMRFNFDLMSGYFFMKKTETLWLNRIIFLETVAGVPGSIGATLRHLHSLRKLQRDHGWIHTLLEEAENERMHLLTAITLRQPGPLFRAAIFLTQGIFFNFYWIAYLLSPKFCHRIVGYLEEQAVVTYTDLLAAIDRKEVWNNTPAPDVAKFYWRLGENSTMRDVIANIRADESHHRDVNHQFADLPTNKTNPFAPGH